MKRKWLIIAVLVLITSALQAQEIPVQLQQQLENRMDATEEETEDDTYWQQLEKFSRHPLNLNQADADDLKELGVLSEWQIENFLRYRNLFGKLLNIYELQAVPSWQPAIIRRLMPFVTVTAAFAANDGWKERVRRGSHTFLLRIAQVLETSKGLERSSPGSRYLGSPQKIFARYRYSYKNLLQFGWLGDKDAGESFFKGTQRYGFDFNSFHLFARKIGIIEALALGDFTVNLGQGLIHWQSMAFKKSGETMTIKRQAPVLRPYNSGGEFSFHRGAGITMRKGLTEMTAFVSFRQLSANRDTDTVQFYSVITYIQSSGFHRTPAEIADKNALNQFTTGVNARFKMQDIQLGVNAVYYQYSLPLQKRDEPYNLYAIKGNRWANYSVDYSYTYRNLHFFGELALDKNIHTAFINGCLISADPALDISFVYRRLTKEYQAINANAFSENTLPSNENGIYAGITIRPASRWKLDAFADLYEFPWLKYLVDAPGYGKDFLLQLTYTPDKKLELQTRVTNSFRLANFADNASVMNYLSPAKRTAWQVQLSQVMSPAFTIRSRLQLLFLQRETNETGYSLYIDGIYKPSMRPFSISARVQYFETSGYNTRLYAYENDVLYSQGIPALFGTGYRYYVVMQIKPAKNISLGCRWAGTVFISQNSIGSGLDVISGNKKTELKTQLIYSIN